VFQPSSSYQVGAGEVSDGDIAYMLSANPTGDFPDLNNASYELAYVSPHFYHVHVCVCVCEFHINW